MLLANRAMLDVPRELAQYLSRLLHAERRRRGTRRNSRALTCFRQAVLGLRWFRQGVKVTALARDHGVSRATGYRYLDEVIDVLADQAPDLHEALEKAKADGLAYVISRPPGPSDLAERPMTYDSCEPLPHHTNG